MPTEKGVVAMKPGTLSAMVFLVFVALAHVLRIVFGTVVLVGGAAVPMWASAAAVVVTGGIAFLLWRDSRT
jgi:hypothetical protein